MIEDRETEPVETYEPAAGPDPKVTIRGFGERLRQILRQAVGALPDVAAVGDGRLRVGLGASAAGDERRA